MKTLTIIILAVALGYYIAVRNNKESKVKAGRSPLQPNTDKQPNSQTAKQPNSQTPIDTSGVKPMPGVSAQEAFLSNLPCFETVLNGLIQDINSKKLWGDWSDLIVTINNKELTEIWQKVVVKPEAWLRILASWGLSYDHCLEFTGIKGRDDLYDTVTGEPIGVGKRYKVVTPVWILTTAEGKKQVFKKGTAEPLA